ncbi:MAG: rhomboid family intramembrane serine protease [Roseiflexaceae bacterium]
MDEVLRRMQSEFGPRREEPEAERLPAPDERYGGWGSTQYGEAQPIPQQSYQVRLPFYHARIWVVLLAINLVIYAVPALLDIFGVRVLGVPVGRLISALGAKVNEAIYQDGQYYRFLTAMFLHGGLLHILFNGYALYSLGPETERIYGTPRFLLIYFIAGFAGGVASYAFSPNPSVGASGAIFGLIGALASFYFVSRSFLGDVARQQLGSLITVIMINLFIGFSTPMIDNYAHLGGLFGGALLGWLLSPRLTLDTRLFPPEAIRRQLPLDWGWALGVLLVLVGLVVVIVPPLP